MVNRYVCPTCGVYLSAPYIRCAECKQPPMSFCLQCFAKGREYGAHQNDHNYVIVKDSFSLFEPSWSAGEEEKLLSAISECGYGNWDDIGRLVGTKSKMECKYHYCYYYIYRPKPPLPVLPVHEVLSHRLPNPVPYMACKDPPRPSITSTLFSEMAGYMPARGEFSLEYDDFLEMSLNDMEIEKSGDRLFMNLQKAVLRIFRYNLKKRARFKCILKRYGLISIQKNFEEWRRYQGFGKTVVDNMRVMMRLMKPSKFDEFMEGILCEQKLKQRIKILQECRQVGITHLRGINMYLKLKQARELRVKHRTLDDVLVHLKDSASRSHFIRKQVLKENSQGLPPTVSSGRRSAPPLSIVGLPGYESLTEDERELCSMCRLYPTSFLQHKASLIHEYRKLGSLTLANARSVIKIDVNKTRKIYDLLIKQSVISKGPL